MKVTYCDDCGAELSDPNNRPDMLPIMARGLKYHIRLQLYTEYSSGRPDLCLTCWMAALEKALNAIREAAKARGGLSKNPIDAAATQRSSQQQRVRSRHDDVS